LGDRQALDIMNVFHVGDDELAPRFHAIHYTMQKNSNDCPELPENAQGAVDHR
jgi:hypothetical protein